MASELLKVALKPTCSNSEVKLIDGASGHTYTILSITICETAGNAETFDMYIDDDDGGTDHYIYKAQALAANAHTANHIKILLEAMSTFHHDMKKPLQIQGIWYLDFKY